MTKVVWVAPISAGFTCAVGEVSVNAAAPIPVSATVCGLPVALSLMLNEAVRVPLAVGENITLTVQLCPTARVFCTAGRRYWSTEKSPLDAHRELRNI